MRLLIPDGWYHVFHRGTERRAIYRDDRDRSHFLDLLSGLHERYRFVIHAYGLMDTHYHAIIQTPNANLSQGMQWAHLSYAAWFNARHNRLGPFWQGRFRAVPIEDSAWAYAVSLYVHLNPVSTEEFGLGKRQRKARKKGWKPPRPEEVTRRLKEIREYRWSSYRSYAGYERGPDWLTTAELLRRATRQRAKRQKQYREDVKNCLRHGVDEAKKERLLDAVAVGSETFRERLKTIAKGGGRETAGKRELRRRATIEGVFRAVAEVKGEEWSEVLGKRADWGRPLALWLARRYCGLTLREIGEAAGGMDYAAVSIALKRFEARLETDPELKKASQQAIAVLNVET